MIDNKAIDSILAAERQEVENFIRLYQVPHLDFGIMINQRWNALDMLAHVLAWHESFALNLSLLAQGEPPQPPRGTLREVNRQGVLDRRGQSVEQLIRRFRKAQKTIEANIYDEGITRIPYRKPGSSYGRAQHLDVVRGHIRNHFWEVIDVYVRTKSGADLAADRGGIG
ncbi:MAG: hypothetical protein K8H74_09970 [Notoacmeibacter sp.]|nr:hypothetical protein [Notoacmeibacter sp.]